MVAALPDPAQENVEFARGAMALVSELGGNLYLMPIRTKLERYLEPLLVDPS